MANDFDVIVVGDLVISIISPTGQTVVMHQQGGLDTYLARMRETVVLPTPRVPVKR